MHKIWFFFYVCVYQFYLECGKMYFLGYFLSLFYIDFYKFYRLVDLSKFGLALPITTQNPLHSINNNKSAVLTVYRHL